MGIIIIRLGVVIPAPVSTVAPASSLRGSGLPEDGPEDEPLGHRQGAQADPHSDGSQKECLHCGAQGGEQHNTEKHPMSHHSLVV